MAKHGQASRVVKQVDFLLLCLICAGYVFVVAIYMVYIDNQVGRNFKLQ
jgi:hypothetical protein